MLLSKSQMLGGIAVILAIVVVFAFVRIWLQIKIGKVKKSEDFDSDVAFYESNFTAYRAEYKAQRREYRRYLRKIYRYRRAKAAIR